MLEPAAHTASWLRQTERARRAGATSTTRGWTTSSGIASRPSAFGLITMRKRSGGTPWFRAESAAQDFAMPCGDHLGATFELADFLERHPGGRAARRRAPRRARRRARRAGPSGSRRLGRDAAADPSDGRAAERGRRRSGGRRHRRRVRRTAHARRHPRHASPRRATSISTRWPGRAADRSSPRRAGVPAPAGGADRRLNCRARRRSDLLVRLDVERERDRRADLSRRRLRPVASPRSSSSSARTARSAPGSRRRTAGRSSP